MSLSAQTLDRLQQLVAADIELQQRLRDADEVDQAVDITVAAAAKRGLAVDADALKSYLLHSAAVPSSESVRDAQLESVCAGSFIRGGIADRRAVVWRAICKDQAP